MGHLNCDHIKQLTALTSDYIKRLSLYFLVFNIFARAPNKYSQQSPNPSPDCLFIRILLLPFSLIERIKTRQRI